MFSLCIHPTSMRPWKRTRCSTHLMGMFLACWAVAVLNVSFLSKGSNHTDNYNLQIAAPDSCKSLFLVHLGPPKTATTTLQCTLGKLSPSLREDGYLHLGKHPTKFCEPGERGVSQQQDEHFECLAIQSCRNKVLSNATWWLSIKYGQTNTSCSDPPDISALSRVASLHVSRDGPHRTPPPSFDRLEWARGTFVGVVSPTRRGHLDCPQRLEYEARLETISNQSPVDPFP
jgi:hypothetical protein